MQWTWCGTGSRNSRITPWAKDRCQTAKPPRDPEFLLLLKCSVHPVPVPHFLDLQNFLSISALYNLLLTFHVSLLRYKPLQHFIISFLLLLSLDSFLKVFALYLPKKQNVIKAQMQISLGAGVEKTRRFYCISFSHYIFLHSPLRLSFYCQRHH